MARPAPALSAGIDPEVKAVDIKGHTLGHSGNLSAAARQDNRLRRRRLPPPGSGKFEKKGEGYVWTAE